MGNAQRKMSNSPRWGGIPVYIAFSTKNNKFVEKGQDKIKQIYASKGEGKHYLVKFVM